jgi:hypothetical protein
MRKYGMLQFNLGRNAFLHVSQATQANVREGSTVYRNVYSDVTKFKSSLPDQGGLFADFAAA